MRRVNRGMRVVLKDSKFPDALTNPENILCKPIYVLRTNFRGDYFFGRGLVNKGTHFGIPTNWIDWDLTDRLNDGTLKPRHLKNRKGVYQMIVNNEKWYEDLINAFLADDMKMIEDVLDSMLVKRRSIISKNIILLYHALTLKNDSISTKARILINQLNRSEFFVRSSVFLNQIKENDLVIYLDEFETIPRIGRYFYDKYRKCGKIELNNSISRIAMVRTNHTIIGNEKFRISDEAISLIKTEWDLGLGAFKRKEVKNV